MPIETSQLLAYVFGFALVATRVTGAFYFVPDSGHRSSILAGENPVDSGHHVLFVHAVAQARSRRSTRMRR